MERASDLKGAGRKRVSRACDRCRSKKDKCDGARPACSACQAAGQTCSYDPSAKKRGLPEGYVRGLEKLWALALCNIDGLENTMLAMLGATSTSAERRPKMMALWTDDGTSEILHETWKTSSISRALEKMLSSSDMPLQQTPDKRQWDERGDALADSNWGFRVTKSSTPLGSDAPRVTDQFTSQSTKKRRLSPPRIGTTAPFSDKDTDMLELPPETSQLLDTYFTITHTWFPIVAKHSILRASYVYTKAPLSIEKVKSRSGDHAALWAILGYTISQLRGVTQEAPPDLFLKVREFYSISWRLIPSESEHYELGHVQALLLLTLINVGLEDWAAAWLLSAQAVRTAISMGLGKYLDTQPLGEMRQSRAVFFGCFVVDSLLSFRLDRTPCMHPHDMAMVGRLDEDGLEEWNSWEDVLPLARGTHTGNSPPRGPLLAISSFNRLVELASAINRIVRGPSDKSNAHAFARHLASEMKQWDDLLPPECRMIEPENLYTELHPPLLPHQTYLGLTYIATLLWLYIRIAPEERGLHPTRQPAIEGAKKLLSRTQTMVAQHMENFQICGLPPIFEVTLRTIGRHASALHDIVKPDTFSFVQWMGTLLQSVKKLEPTWPVYKSLASTIEYRRCHENKADASPMALPGDASDATSASPDGYHGGTIGMSDMCETERLKLRSGPSMPQRKTPKSIRRNSNRSSTPTVGIDILMDGSYAAAKDAEMESAEFPMGNELPDQVGRSADFAGKFALGSGCTQMQQLEYPRRAINSNSKSVLPTSTAHADQYTPPIDDTDFTARGPRLDDPEDMMDSVDSIFKDLVYLDATDWAVSREAALKDFGFMDDTTFQAFCHDPDRLGGSQPLIHPSSIADIWPPPGFFPEAFQEDTNNDIDH